MLWFIQHLLFLRKMLKASDTPRQLAFGFAMGMVLGLVPKDNLLALAISMAILSVRVNMGAAMIAALLFSLIGTIADPLTHRIGEFVLTQELLTSFWQSTYRLPLMPWTAFNNTVVMGSFLLGLASFYPVYRISFRVFEKRQSRSVEDEPEVAEEIEEQIESDDPETNQPLIAA